MATCTATRVCMYCGAELRSRTGFIRHVNGHENRTPYTCCGKNFFDSTKLHMHRCSKHGREADVECDTCGKMFASKQQVCQHVSLVHTDPAFKCDTCGVEYKSKRSLSDHIQRQHLGERQYKCACGKTYSYASGFYRHKRATKH